MLTHQPVKPPPSGESSSFTQRFQVPFGFDPLKTERAEPPPGAGAGAGNAPFPRVVGLYVPETRGPVAGSEVAAASLNRKFTPVTAVLPPTRDMISAFPPDRRASNTSTSLGKVCEKPFRFTVAEHRYEGKPVTTIEDG